MYRVYILGSYYPKPAGAEIYSGELVQELIKLGLKVKVVTYSYGKPYLDEKVVSVRTLNAPFIRGASFTLLSMLHLLKEDLNEKTIVNAHFATISGFSASLAKKVRDFPLVVTCHGSDVLNASKNLFYRGIFTFSANNSEKVIAVSSFLKREISKLGVSSGKVSVVRGGVNTVLFNTSIPKDKAREILNLKRNRKYILFVGSSGKIKGLIYLLEAFKKLSNTFRDLYLLIAGRIPQKDLYKGLDKEIADRIINLGVQPYIKMPFVMRCADIFVLPSLFESFGLSLLEAASSGVPFVASNVGGIPELVRELMGRNYPFLVPSGDVEAIYHACAELLANDSLRIKISLKCLEHVRDFSWRKTALETLKVFKEAIGLES